MPDQVARARPFLELQEAGRPPLLPNPWDAGSAKQAAHAAFTA